MPRKHPDLAVVLYLSDQLSLMHPALLDRDGVTFTPISGILIPSDVVAFWWMGMEWPFHPAPMLQLFQILTLALPMPKLWVVVMTWSFGERISPSQILPMLSETFYGISRESIA